MKGRLWQCDRQWRRLHAQAVEFNKWPKVGAAFYFKSECASKFANTAMVQVVEVRGSEHVRFKTKDARYELEKLP